ncbi:MAG TPA: hypothetical protein ENJ33_08275 [Thiothrix sp.]|nr:hypothetical protein [Thiothrix sp.]
MLKQSIILLFSTLLLTGCGSVHYNNVHMGNDNIPVATKLSTEQKQSISELKTALLNLGENTSEAEATLIAYDSVVYSMILANQYKLASPPLYHNYLVNTKRRPRGLCYHWQRDLISHLKKRKNFKTFDLKEGVSAEGEYWNEHNAMIVTAKGQPFETGIVLDGWRNSGKLFWVKVTKETKHHWKQRVWKTKKIAKKSIPKAS